MDKRLLGKVELKKKGEVGLLNRLNISTRVLSQKRKTFVTFIGKIHEPKNKALAKGSSATLL